MLIEETWVRSLNQEDPLEEGVANHSSTLAWRIPWTEEPGDLQSLESQRVGHDWSDLAYMQASKRSSMFHVASFPNSSHISSVQSLSCVRLFVTPWIVAHARLPCPSPTPGACSNSCSSSRWCHPIISSSVVPFSSCLQSFPVSWYFLFILFYFFLFVNHGIFKWVSYSYHLAKVLEFQLQCQSSNECSRLISFRMDWLDLLAVQGTLKSLLQHHSSKASILWHSAFFMVQLSHPYVTTGKSIALTRQTCIGNVKPLLFNMLSRLVKTFLPRSKHLLISWLYSPSAMILEPKEINSIHE